MKKIALFSAVALLLSLSIGCSTNGTSSWCRSGSLFPTARTKETTQVVYTTSATASQCEPAYCNPCEAAVCSPCEAAGCNPCDPVCDPCAPGSSTGVYAPRVVPGPIN